MKNDVDVSLLNSVEMRRAGERASAAEHAARVAAGPPSAPRTLTELRQERAGAVRLVGMLDGSVSRAEALVAERSKALDVARSAEAEAVAAVERAKASYVNTPTSAAGAAVVHAEDERNLVALRLRAATEAEASAANELEVAKSSRSRARSDVDRLECVIAADADAFHAAADPVAISFVAHIRGLLSDAKALADLHTRVEDAQRRHRRAGHGEIAGAPDHGHVLLAALDELASAGIAVSEHDQTLIRYATSGRSDGGPRGIETDLASIVALLARVVRQEPAGDGALARFREVLAVMREVPRLNDIGPALLARAEERRKAAPPAPEPKYPELRPDEGGRTVGPKIGRAAPPSSPPSIVGRMVNGAAAAARSLLAPTAKVEGVHVQASSTGRAKKKGERP